MNLLLIYSFILFYVSKTYLLFIRELLNKKRETDKISYHE